MNLRKRVLLSIVFVASAAAVAYAFARDDSASASNTVVQGVTDGDTITVRIAGNSEKVRLIGIDTPETVDPKRPVGCYGREASEFTKSLLPKGTSVRVVLDAEPRDRYDRLLAYVYRTSDGLFVNAEIARQGYAQQLTIAPNIAHSAQFSQSVSEAREANRGLWAHCPDPTSK